MSCFADLPVIYPGDGVGTTIQVLDDVNVELIDCDVVILDDIVPLIVLVRDGATGLEDLDEEDGGVTTVRGGILALCNFAGPATDLRDLDDLL